MVVVAVEDVVPVATPEMVLVGAADEPVVADVAEEVVLAVVDDRHGRRVQSATGGFEVEEEVDARGNHHLAIRVVLVVPLEHRRRRVVREHVAERVSQRGKDRERVVAVGVVERERLGTGDRIVAGAAVNRVVAETAVDDIALPTKNGSRSAT